MIGIENLGDVISVHDAGNVRQSFLKRVWQKPLGMVSITYLLVVIVACALAPLIAPYNPLAQDLSSFQQGPSMAHLLGTDSLGRDVLSRLLFGGRTTLIGVGEAALTASFIGITIGLIAGYFGGWFDRLIGRTVDLIMSLPTIIILLSVLIIFNQSMLSAMVTYGFLGSMAVLRVVRGGTLAVREEQYVSAAKVSGLSNRQIIIRHIVPRVTGPIIVQISIFSSSALVVQAGLSFLGLGIAPPAPSWGGLIEEAQQVLLGDPWLLVPSGLIVALTVLALGLFGDAVRDTTHERWSGGGGFSRKLSVSRTGQVSEHSKDIPEMPSGAVLSVRDLSIARGFGNVSVDVVNGVNFDLFSGEKVGVVGESGCGKTLTMLAIMGLLPKGLFVTSGTLRIKGKEYALSDPKSLGDLRGTEIGMIFQQPVPSLDPAFRVGDQLDEVIRQHFHIPRKLAKEKTFELLRRVSLDAEVIYKKYPSELSGGMAQRVAIARALAGNPSVLIADEPTTALDVSIQAEVLQLIRNLVESTTMSVILVTHDWGVIADMCDRALVLYAGQIVEVAEISELWNHALHPYSSELLKANPHFAERGKPLPTIVGRVPEPGQRPVGCYYSPRCKLSSDECDRGSIPMLSFGLNGDHLARCIHSERLASSVGDV